MATKFPPEREAEFVTFTQNFASKIATGFATYSLTTAQATAYGTLSTAFINAYNVAQADATRSPMNINLKNVAKKNLIANLRMLCKIIQNAPTTTNAMRIDLGIPQRGTTPTPIPPPSLSPGIVVTKAVNRTISVRLFDPQNPKKTAKPAGVSGITVFSFVGSAPPTDIGAWKYEGSSSVMKFDIEFAPSVPNGATVWLTAFFFNNRKQSGVAATPISANLPGGGVSMAITAEDVTEVRKAA